VQGLEAVDWSATTQMREADDGMVSKWRWGEERKGIRTLSLISVLVQSILIRFVESHVDRLYSSTKVSLFE